MLLLILLILLNNFIVLNNIFSFFWLKIKFIFILIKFRNEIVCVHFCNKIKVLNILNMRYWWVFSNVCCDLLLRQNHFWLLHDNLFRPYWLHSIILILGIFIENLKLSLNQFVKSPSKNHQLLMPVSWLLIFFNSFKVLHEFICDEKVIFIDETCKVLEIFTIIIILLNLITNSMQVAELINKIIQNRVKWNSYIWLSVLWYHWIPTFLVSFFHQILLLLSHSGRLRIIIAPFICCCIISNVWQW